jgi:hypothetical protein
MLIIKAPARNVIGVQIVEDIRHERCRNPRQREKQVAAALPEKSFFPADLASPVRLRHTEKKDIPYRYGSS